MPFSINSSKYDFEKVHIPHQGACQYDQTGDILIPAPQHPPSPTAQNNCHHKRNPENVNLELGLRQANVIDMNDYISIKYLVFHSNLTFK